MTGVKRPSFAETLVFSRGAGILGEKKFLENFVGNRMENTIEGRETERLSSIRALMRTAQLTAEKAMDMLAIPKAKQGHYKALL